MLKKEGIDNEIVEDAETLQVKPVKSMIIAKRIEESEGIDVMRYIGHEK